MPKDNSNSPSRKDSSLPTSENLFGDWSLPPKEPERGFYFIPDIPDIPEPPPEADPDIDKKTSGIFIGLWKKRDKKDPKFSCSSEHQDIKLHISLSNEHYARFHTEISNILIEFLRQDIIYQFKKVDPTVLDEDLKWYLKVKTQLTLYKADKTDNKQFNLKNYPYLENFCNDHQGRRVEALPQNPDDIGIIETALEKRTVNATRFIKGDQFTIYIPKDADPKKIAKMRDTLHKFMLEKNMTGGEISDVALALTAQINARMEYFPGESRYVKKRINALKDSGESKEHRDAAKQLLRKNPIFQYLESQQELTASNVSANKLEEKSPSEAANGGVLSCFWLINFLAHPATLPVFLIIVGAAGLALGGIGLAGITTGLTMLGAQILTGVAVGATTGGGGLGLYRLFSALKEPKGEASPPVAEAKAVPF